MKLPNTQFSLGFSYFLPLGQNSIPRINVPMFFSLNAERPRFTLIQNGKIFEFLCPWYYEAKSQCNFL